MNSAGRWTPDADGASGAVAGEDRVDASRNTTDTSGETSGVTQAGPESTPPRRRGDGPTSFSGVFHVPREEREAMQARAAAAEARREGRAPAPSPSSPQPGPSTPPPASAPEDRPSRLARVTRYLRNRLSRARIVRYWTSTLSGRLIAVMLLAVALSQAVFMLIARTERYYVMRVVLKEECLGRVSSSVQLAQATPAAQRPEILNNLGTPMTRYWISPNPPGSPDEWQEQARDALRRPVYTAGDSTPMVRSFQDTEMLKAISSDPWEILSPDAWILHVPVHVLPLQQWNGYGFAVKLNDGTWLNTVFAKPNYLMGSTSVTPGYWAAVALSVLIFAGTALFVANRISQPLQHLTQSAERLGRGEQLELLKEEGPDDIRCCVAAFNRMQIRLRRFVEDRVRMLAAVGHDLRTPITSLRLRAEFIPDQDTRDKFLATLAEMQTMTEAALNFARSEASGEPTRVVDLTALLESLCDDLADMGWDVRFLGAGPANAVNAAALTHAREAAPGETDGEPVRDAEAEIVPVRLPCACRPDAIRRAVRNVIENAVRYGDRARVFLHTGPALSTPCTAGATRNGTSATMASSPDGVEIVVEDDGPGVPEADRANIFAPFVRLETSRNRSTGGVGLGLSIARSILRGHGGDIYLTQPPAPRPQGAGPGLRVHLRLPSCDPEQAARRA